jgi:uncharacterized membrane protein YidH (DUF202 family)
VDPHPSCAAGSAIHKLRPFNCWGGFFNLKYFFKQIKFKQMQKNVGIWIVVIGVIMMIYTGFNYVTKEKVVDLGAIEINKEKSHPVNWSPIVGAILIVGGIVLIASSKKKLL